MPQNDATLPIPSPSNAWVDLVDVVTMIQSSIHKANASMLVTSKAEGQSMQYVVNELNVSIAAELVTESGVTMLRFPSNLADPTTSIPDAQLSRISLSLRPVPILTEETQPSGPGTSPIKPWTLSKTEVTTRFNGVWGGDDGVIHVVGDKGMILRSKDDGASWTKSAISSGAALFGIWGSDASQLYAVGDKGTLLRGDGQSWEQVPLGTGARLVSVWGTGADNIYVAGVAGTILHSTDGGVSWASQDSGISTDLHAVWAFDGKRVFAGGDGGALLRTMDGGASWQPCFQAATDIIAISGSSPTEIVVATHGGPLFRSADGGDSWTALTGGPDVAYVDVWAFGGGEIHALAEDGSIVRARDFGKIWSVQNELSGYSLRSLWGSAPDRMFAVGASGVVLRGPVAS
ncbi:Hypothetical protein A7982_11679 [Minicystis rosea]|nr:Hypothetical protein A7982_11679 [Minicystis rosea]